MNKILFKATDEFQVVKKTHFYGRRKTRPKLRVRDAFNSPFLSNSNLKCEPDNQIQGENGNKSARQKGTCKDVANGTINGSWIINYF